MVDKELKRINPDTGKFFKKGDVRPSTDKQDRKIFWAYQSLKAANLKNGLYQESWIGLFDFEKRQSKKDARTIGSKEFVNKLNKQLSKRKNDKNKDFQKGDRVGDKYFIRYLTSNNYLHYRKQGMDLEGKLYWDEVWGSEDDVFDDKIRTKAVKTQLGYEYLKSIFPKDKKCPISRKPFSPLARNSDSPELDQIDPRKGYKKDNVVWISQRMNRLKDNSSIDELLRLAHYVSTYSVIDKKQRKEFIKQFKEDMEESNKRQNEMNKSLKEKGIKPIKF